MTSSMTGQSLRISSVDEDVDNLGPVMATVLRTQGCHIYCHGCIARDTWNANGGVLACVEDVARWLKSTSNNNLVITGGEASEQAEAVVRLLELLGSDWIITLHSGRDLVDLQEDPDPAIARLLDRVDLLVAGPYIEALHDSLLYRGSSNQMIHNLSGRVTVPPDETAGVIVRIRRGLLEAIGVPPAPGFLDALQAAAAELGVELTRPADPNQFPFPVINPEA